ncbi:MAG: hypothetical protein FJY88_09055, partial [Candidatus Eisenbacteria bacterium]|nr:hypothetical protein [Candidatus Eisenbacteria bacterium]
MDVTSLHRVTTLGGSLGALRREGNARRSARSGTREEELVGAPKESTGGASAGGSPPVFKLNKRGSSPRVVQALVPILRDDGVVLLPTDTIYGFSGRFDSPLAWKRIRDLKGSDRSAPMLSLVAGPEMAFQYAEPPHGASYEILIKYWPGPLTAVLRARPHVPTEF